MAVVGHVEWVDFVVVAALPTPGEIVEAEETWEEAAGGGAVAAVQLRKLAGHAAFYTALGNDERARLSKSQLEPAAPGCQLPRWARGADDHRAGRSARGRRR